MGQEFNGGDLLSHHREARKQNIMKGFIDDESLHANQPDADLEKGATGEGSKGGKVIGHTKSGKPIYDTTNHEGHKEYTHQDHQEAALYHTTQMAWDLEAAKQEAKHDKEGAKLSRNSAKQHKKIAEYHLQQRDAKKQDNK